MLSHFCWWNVQKNIGLEHVFITLICSIVGSSVKLCVLTYLAWNCLDYVNTWFVAEDMLAPKEWKGWLFSRVCRRWWVWANVLVVVRNGAISCKCHASLLCVCDRLLFCYCSSHRKPPAEAEEGPGPQDAGKWSLQCVWGQGLGLPLQRAELWRLQGLLPPQCHQGRPVRLQEWRQVWDGHVYAAQVPGVPAAQVPGGRHAGAVWVQEVVLGGAGMRERGWAGGQWGWM